MGLSEQIEEYQKSIAKAEERLQQLQSEERTRIALMQEENQRLQDQIIDLALEKETLEAEVKHNVMTIDIQRGELERLRVILQDSEEEIKQLNSDKAFRDRKIETLEQRICDITESLRDSEQERDYLQEGKDELKEERDKLQEELDELQEDKRVPCEIVFFNRARQVWELQEIEFKLNDILDKEIATLQKLFESNRRSSRDWFSSNMFLHTPEQVFLVTNRSGMELMQYLNTEARC